MHLLADSSAEDSLRVAVKGLEGLAAAAVAIAGAWYVVRSRRQDARERDIKLSRDQYQVDHERDEDERKAKREDRDEVIQELRGMIDEAKSETREIKRDWRKGQEATARKMAEIQAAHHECEKAMAAQAVQISHLKEVNEVTRARLLDAEQKIKELEDRSGEHHAPPA